MGEFKDLAMVNNQNAYFKLRCKIGVWTKLVWVFERLTFWEALGFVYYITKTVQNGSGIFCNKTNIESHLDYHKFIDK